MNLRIGKKTLTMVPFPGHSPDNIGVIVEEDRVMFAGDVFMPIPYIVDGDVDEMVLSLKEIGKMGLDEQSPRGFNSIGPYQCRSPGNNPRIR